MARLCDEVSAAGASVMGPLGNSTLMESVRGLIAQVAQHDTLVLIQGESGSGKEVVARAVHDASPRKDKPFIPVNCGAIPADLLESELFGHEKGAFTGAIAARKGRFEMAEGGTLFLDEIGDMSLPMQVKLLRVLQERCFERVGSNQTIQCNVRIIAATHRDLASMIEEGSFRHDLYFRLNVFPIEVPPLREHTGDLPQLINHFIAKQKERGLPAVKFTQASIDSLKAYDWPGNIRELENLIERLAITQGGNLVRIGDLPVNYRSGDEQDDRGESAELAEAISGSHMAAEFRPDDALLPDAGIDLKSHLQELEKSYISEALRKSNGTVTRAAQLLGLQRTTLAEKMKKLGMQAQQ